jgi:hypothetical protein
VGLGEDFLSRMFRELILKHRVVLLELHHVLQVQVKRILFATLLNNMHLLAL